MDYQAAIAKLRQDAQDAAMIRDLAVERTKHDTFDLLSLHLSRLADDVEKAMKEMGKK